MAIPKIIIISHQKLTSAILALILINQRIFNSWLSPCSFEVISIPVACLNESLYLCSIHCSIIPFVGSVVFNADIKISEIPTQNPTNTGAKSNFIISSRSKNSTPSIHFQKIPPKTVFSTIRGDTAIATHRTITLRSKTTTNADNGKIKRTAKPVFKTKTRSFCDIPCFEKSIDVE